MAFVNGVPKGGLAGEVSRKVSTSNSLAKSMSCQGPFWHDIDQDHKHPLRVEPLIFRAERGPNITLYHDDVILGLPFLCSAHWDY